jgi:hypothetical protein
VLRISVSYRDLPQYLKANMTKSLTFLFVGAILIVGIALSSGRSAEAVPVHFPDRHQKPVTSAPSVDAQGHTKCPRGHRLVHGNCRKVYG